MATDSTKTEVGSYFISNYPPYSQWSPEQLGEIEAAFQAPPADVPLGLYLHIPFCRKRCKFCYFKVFTDNNASEIETYVSALSREIELVSQLPVMGDRPFRFVYFGGGTPSFLSPKQLTSLVDRLRASINWDHAEEVTFECEPGTLSESKIKTIRELGITRLSLGVEHFNDEVLKENGRAHLSAEVYRSWEWIQAADFPNVNIDLISGMVGETWDRWKDSVRRTLELAPDSVTIYQMELPHNTVISREMKELGLASPVANWPTKRRWVSEAFDRLLSEGYQISSGNELVKDLQTDHFVYRDNLFRGADLLAAGVSSFGHFQGVHYQNFDQLADYVAAVDEGKLPINRALTPTPHQRLIRELVLQIKEGHVSARPFRQKFGVNILDEFAEALHNQQAAGYLTVEGDDIRLTRKGLLQADSLLTEYFEPEHREVRYT